jgi:hypothetical protein
MSYLSTLGSRAIKKKKVQTEEVKAVFSALDARSLTVPPWRQPRGK